MLKAQVISRREETPDIVVLELADANDQPLTPFKAGAHIDLELGPGLIRQYSLCRLADGERAYQIAVLKDPASRGGSLAVHGLAIGDRLRISEPRNNFPLIPGPHKTLLLAGGIGVTPLLCMAWALHEEGADFELHYCARSPAQAAFRQALGDAPFSAQVFMHFDDGAEDQRLRIDPLLASLDRDAHIYVCGPAGFISHVADAATRAIWPETQLHREYFKADGSSVVEGDRAFQVKLASTGQIVPVAADQTILAALKAHGIDLAVSCEAGVCGTCLTGVIEGAPDHRDYYLNPAEKAAGDLILPCCSRAKSDLLVLDL